MKQVLESVVVMTPEGEVKTLRKMSWNWGIEQVSLPKRIILFWKQ